MKRKNEIVETVTVGGVRVDFSPADMSFIKYAARQCRNAPAPNLVILKRTCERMTDGNGCKRIFGAFIDWMLGKNPPKLEGEEYQILMELEAVQNVILDEWRKAGGKAKRTRRLSARVCDVEFPQGIIYQREGARHE